MALPPIRRGLPSISGDTLRDVVSISGVRGKEEKETREEAERPQKARMGQDVDKHCSGSLVGHLSLVCSLSSAGRNAST